MAKAWRVVLWIVLFLLAAGVVLMGAAWLTGASNARIVELAFGGQEGVDAWLATVRETAVRLWTTAIGQIKNLL